MITKMLGVSKEKLTPHKKDNKKENGIAVDLFSTCIVIIVTFMLVLVMLTFAKVVEIKIDSDIIGKNYLYRMEQQGYFNEAVDLNDMEKSFIDKGIITNSSGSIALDRANTTIKQVAYGSPVSLKFTVNFPNPMYTYLPNNVAGFGNLNLRGAFAKEVSYKLEYTTTSKW